MLTLGADGVEVDGERLPIPPADVVDPTGDAFCAGFALALAEGRSLRDAVCF